MQPRARPSLNQLAARSHSCHQALKLSRKIKSTLIPTLKQKRPKLGTQSSSLCHDSWVVTPCSASTLCFQPAGETSPSSLSSSASSFRFSNVVRSWDREIGRLEDWKKKYVGEWDEKVRYISPYAQNMYVYKNHTRTVRHSLYFYMEI